MGFDKVREGDKNALALGDIHDAPAKNSTDLMHREQKQSNKPKLQSLREFDRPTAIVMQIFVACKGHRGQRKPTVQFVSANPSVLPEAQHAQGNWNRELGFDC